MLDPFDQKKQCILREISNDSLDASPKGTIDVLCIPIMNLINAHRDMVTTSSCSGRVSVFLEGIKGDGGDGVQIGSKGNSGRWLFVTHEPAELSGWYKDIGIDIDFTENGSLLQVNNTTRYVLYKFEPLILHVKCRNSTAAQALYTTAMGCGFRETGIGSNNIVGIRISIKLDAPIGFMDDEEKLVGVVSEGYLELLTKLSLDRFQENEKKIAQLYDAIEKMGQDMGAKKVVESKEERRIRKIAEGLERREGVRAQKAEKAEKALKSRQEIQS